jgi:Trypsin-like peptidase domain/Effector-associated domain 9
MAAIANSYVPAFKSAIARIFHANGAVVGAGFLVAGRSQSYLVTCAHVVTAALSLPSSTDMPSGNIYLDFPLVAPDQKLTAKVVFWRSVKTASSEPEDIAGLVLEGQLPIQVAPIKLISTDDVWEHPLRIFGFPSGHNDGVWATGVLRDRQAKGWVQIEDVKVSGYRVEPGFSGAPIWDETLAGVVGMAVAAEKQREQTKTAFMIPASTLLDVWSELVPLNSSPPTENKRILKSTKQFRAEIIQDSIKSLQEDYEAAYNQLNYALSEVDRSRLKRQIKSLEGEMEGKESELNDLLD